MILGANCSRIVRMRDGNHSIVIGEKDKDSLSTALKSTPRTINGVRLRIVEEGPFVAGLGIAGLSYTPKVVTFAYQSLKNFLELDESLAKVKKNGD